MKFRFVVIDDATFIREILKNLLTRLGGHCVGEADGGDSGLRVVQVTLPDVVFLDLVMPERNGLQVLKKIKAEHPEIQVIVCSTMDDTDVIEQAEALGAARFIQKPFERNEIELALKQVLSGKGIQNHV